MLVFSEKPLWAELLMNCSFLCLYSFHWFNVYLQKKNSIFATISVRILFTFSSSVHYLDNIYLPFEVKGSTFKELFILCCWWRLEKSEWSQLNSGSIQKGGRFNEYYKLKITLKSIKSNFEISTYRRNGQLTIFIQRFNLDGGELKKVKKVGCCE